MWVLQLFCHGLDGYFVHWDIFFKVLLKILFVQLDSCDKCQSFEGIFSNLNVKVLKVSIIVTILIFFSLMSSFSV